jgi:hypothetical protein
MPERIASPCIAIINRGNMRKLALVLILILPSLAKAQIYDIPCPPGYPKVLSRTINYLTGHYKAYICMATNGDVWFLGLNPPGGVTTVTASLPDLSSGGPTPNISCPTCAIGPGASTANHLATWLNNGGLVLKDGGPIPAGTVTSVTFTGDGTVLSATPSAPVTGSGTLTAALANAGAYKALANLTAAPAHPSYVDVQGTDIHLLSSGEVTGVASPLCTDANGGATTVGCPSAGGFDPNHVTFFDDFLSWEVVNWNGNAGNQVLRWVTGSCYGCSAFFPQPNNSNTNAVGVWEMLDGNPGAWGYMYLSSDWLLNPQAKTFKIYARVENHSPSSGKLRFGLVQIANENPNQFVYFEANATGTPVHWTCQQSDHTGIASVDSGIPSEDSYVYHVLEIDASATNSVVWKIDGTPVCAGITGYFPNTTLTPAFETIGNASGEGQMWIDYFRMDLTTVGR